MFGANVAAVNYPYRVSIKFLCNFKDLLRRQVRGQSSGNCYKARGVCLSFFSALFKEARGNLNIYVLFCNNFYLSVFSVVFVINF